MSQLAVIQMPPFIFANNPAEVVFLRRGIFDDLGGYAYLICYIEDTPGNGETLKFDIGDTAPETITFTFRDEPEGYDELPRRGSLSPFQYLQAVAQHLYRHPAIRKDYYVQPVGTSTPSLQENVIIKITARRRGKKYNIEVNNTSTSNVNTNNISFQITDDDLPLEDYKLKLRATVITDPMYHWEEKDVDDIEATGLPDADRDVMKITVYELPELARSVMGADIPHNPFLPMPMRKASCFMKIEAEESYTAADGKAVIQEFLDMDNTGGDAPRSMYVPVAGGLSVHSFPFKSFEQLVMGAQPRFWTLQPGYEKIISMGQPEWLSVYYYNAVQYSYHWKAYYVNGSSLTGSINNISVMNTPLTIPTGVTQCGIPSTNSGSALLRYEIILSVQDDDSLITGKTFSYLIDQRYFKEERYFIYQNSLGAIDTLRCVGVQKFSVKRSGATSGIAMSSQARSDRGTMEMVYNELEHQWTMRTGWLLNKEEKELMLDFLRSPYIAEVVMPLLTPDTETIGEGEEAVTIKHYYRQPYRSVIMLQDTVDMWEDEGVWGFEWKMMNAYRDTQYSNMPALKERWFDSVMEFTVNVENIPDLGLYIYIDCNPDAAFYYEVNGLQSNSNQYNFTKTGLYHIKVKGSNLKEFSIQLNVTSMATITPLRIETTSLKALSLKDFDRVLGHYWIKRLEHLHSLEELTIYTGTNPGCDVDAVMGAVAALHLHHPKLNPIVRVIDITCSTPSAYASNVADYLTANFSFSINFS